jgi:RNA polymerase sigma-70 factor (ECF subfamily)
LQRFENLLIDQIPALRRYARALCRDPVQADDLLQECLARAVGRRRLWISSRGMRPWLFAILHNVYVDDLRRQAASRLDAGASADPRSVPSDQDADLLCAVSDFEQALDRLSAEQREVLLLVGLEQLTYRQAAKVIGAPVGTVMSRLARAREKLSSNLEGEIKQARIKRVK